MFLLLMYSKLLSKIFVKKITYVFIKHKFHFASNSIHIINIFFKNTEIEK